MDKKAGKKIFLIAALGAALFCYECYAADAGADEAAGSSGAETVQEGDGNGGFISPVERLLAAREAEAERIEAFRKAREDREQALKAAQLAREETARARASGKLDSPREETGDQPAAQE